LTNTNSFHHIHCHDKLSIKINSIKYFYDQYDCTVNLHDPDEKLTICSNQSSCILNLKPFLFAYITECRTVKLKFIRLNYTCVNKTFKSINVEPRKNAIILCISIIIFVSLLALFCSYLQHISANEQKNNSIMNDSHHIHTQSIYDNQIKQEYELKNLLIVESSSLSTLTSLNNKNIITNPSEYDNLIKIEHLSPLKVKFTENYQIK